MIESLIDWLIALIEKVGYLGVGLAMFLESFFAPIPSEIILPFTGFVASIDTINIYIALVIATLSAYLGSLPFYFLGYWGEGVVNKFLDKYGKYFFISKKDVENTFKVFNKYGNGIVLLGRLIPIIRTLISFPAGVAKMNFWLFSLFTLIGTAVWSALLMGAGYFLSDQWQIVIDWLSLYEDWVIRIGIFVVILFVGRGIYNNFLRGKK